MAIDKDISGKGGLSSTISGDNSPVASIPSWAVAATRDVASGQRILKHIWAKVAVSSFVPIKINFMSDKPLAESGPARFTYVLP